MNITGDVVASVASFAAKDQRTSAGSAAGAFA
jgi:hypothetical protein